MRTRCCPLPTLLSTVRPSRPPACGCCFLDWPSFVTPSRALPQACKRILGLRIRSRFGGKLCVEYEGRDVVIAVSHVGVEISFLRSCMQSEEAAATSFTLRSKYPNRVRAMRACVLAFALAHAFSSVFLLIVCVPSPAC